MTVLPAAPVGASPLVSVLVPAYNAEATIAATCRSALAQRYPSIEVIVVDDGSTDQTSGIVAALATQDPRLRLFRQENQGVAAARNRAIAESRGEFLAPLDADDLWSSDKIARQVARMQAGGPDMGLVYCWWAWIDEANRILDRSPRWEVEGGVLERLAEINFTGNASVPLFRRSAVIELGGYRRELREADCQGCEDWDLALRVAERHAVGVVPAVLVGYRRRVQSMSAQTATMRRSHTAVLAALVQRNPGIPAAVQRRSRGQFALYLAGLELAAGRFLRACRFGLETRPPGLALAVLPSVLRLLWKRRMGGLSGRRELPEGSACYDKDCPPEPLIPYDRIYREHWRREGLG